MVHLIKWWLPNLVQIEYCLISFNFCLFYKYVVTLWSWYRTIEIGADRFKIPDILFNPSLAQVDVF